MANRVVITGMGVVSPIGNDVETFWNSLKENKRGFGEITYFDTTDYKVKLAAQVKDFDPKQYMDPKTARRMEPVDFKNCAGDRIRSDCFRYWIKAVACRFNVFDVFSAVCASAFRTFGKRSAKTF